MHDPDHAKDVREHLKRARLSLGLTLQDVAERTAVLAGLDRLSRQTVWFWEAGQRQPRPDYLAAWARAVDLRLVLRVVEPDADIVGVEVRPDLVELVDRLKALDPLRALDPLKAHSLPKL